MSIKVWRFRVLIILLILAMAGTAYTAYHHSGDTDSKDFQQAHPEMIGTKLDHCALCHTGGEYERKPGVFVSMGSCQWCHYKYGYDETGNIEETLNGYGLDYKEYGRTQQAFGEIKDLDSDGDGFSNKEEIEAIRYPGDPDDDPTKVEAPYRVYTLQELENLPQQTQFMLMNTHKSGDFYVEYTGITIKDLLTDAGILASSTGISVHAPDGWSQYHPLEPDSDPLLYSVLEDYPQADYYYHEEADQNINNDYGWCDYSAPSCQGWEHGDLILNDDGNSLLLAIMRDDEYLEPGKLNDENKLDGEGPFRVVPPQKMSGPPDQSVKSDEQDVEWPFDEYADHNAGFATRSTTIIRVEPLPDGTTDINTLEAGWNYIDEEKIVVYGAIDPIPSIIEKLSELKHVIRSMDKDFFKNPKKKNIMAFRCQHLSKSLKKGHIDPVQKQIENWFAQKVDGCVENGTPDKNDWILECEAQKQIYWKLNEMIVLLNIKS